MLTTTNVFACFPVSVALWSYTLKPTALVTYMGFLQVFTIATFLHVVW